MKLIKKTLLIAIMMSSLTSISYAQQLIQQQQVIVQTNTVNQNIVPPRNGILIHNAQDYPIKYSVNDYSTMIGKCTPLSISEGGLTGKSSVTFTKGMFTDALDVCVHVSGQTSITGVGGWTRVKNNNGCVLTVENNGFLKGIKIEYSPGCMVDGRNAVAVR